MGVEANIGLDIFPNQSNQLGQQVEVVRTNDKGSIAEQGTIVRDDVVDPFKGLIKLKDGTVVLDTERDEFTEPPQGSYKNKRAKVCFNYDANRTIEGTIVRDDMEKPWLTVIKLDLGRYVLATECQFSPQR
jgi:hypothetical protein